jgi:CitB-like protein
MNLRRLLAPLLVVSALWSFGCANGDVSSTDMGVATDMALADDTGAPDMGETPCPSGYAGTVESGCVDVDECVTLPNACDELTTCTNSDGGFTCSTCPPGTLGRGETGCSDIDDPTPDRRRLFHHLTLYGFLLCLASTSVATLYHYLLGREAPYPWYDLPVLLGTLGGIGLLVGPIGLLREKAKRAPATRVAHLGGMEMAFVAMLFLTSLTGLALLVLRETPAMGLLLACHLGIVFGLFLTLPYGKFVHGLYRYAALARYAKERKSGRHAGK